MRRGHVEHHAPHVHGQAAGRHPAPGQSVNELLFPALWIARAQRAHFYPCPLRGCAQGRDGARLVIFHADSDGLRTRHVRGNPRAQANVPRRCQHQAVVAGKIRLALRAIEQERIHLLFPRRRQLYMRGKACAAHAHNARLANAREECLHRRFERIFHGREGLAPLVQAIVFHHNGFR